VKSITTMGELLLMTYREQSYGYIQFTTFPQLITHTLKLLYCGKLEGDEGWFKRGGGTTTLSAPDTKPERRKLVIISILIEHPAEGLILYETGGGKDYPEVWGAPLNDVFAQVDYSPDHELEAQSIKRDMISKTSLP
jgi:hypothetical protein